MDAVDSPARYVQTKIVGRKIKYYEDGRSPDTFYRVMHKLVNERGERMHIPKGEKAAMWVYIDKVTIPLENCECLHAAEDADNEYYSDVEVPFEVRGPKKWIQLPMMKRAKPQTEETQTETLLTSEQVAEQTGTGRPAGKTLPLRQRSPSTSSSSDESLPNSGATVDRPAGKTLPLRQRSPSTSLSSDESLPNSGATVDRPAGKTLPQRLQAMLTSSDEDSADDATTSPAKKKRVGCHINRAAARQAEERRVAGLTKEEKAAEDEAATRKKSEAAKKGWQLKARPQKTLEEKEAQKRIWNENRKKKRFERRSAELAALGPAVLQAMIKRGEARKQAVPKRKGKERANGKEPADQPIKKKVRKNAVVSRSQKENPDAGPSSGPGRVPLEPQWLERYRMNREMQAPPTYVPPPYVPPPSTHRTQPGPGGHWATIDADAIALLAEVDADAIALLAEEWGLDAEGVTEQERLDFEKLMGLSETEPGEASSRSRADAAMNEEGRIEQADVGLLDDLPEDMDEFLHNMAQATQASFDVGEGFDFGGPAYLSD